MDIKDVTADQVLSVYSGTDGKCMCGCSGKYRYNPGWKNLAGEIRGYEVDDEEFSLRSIKTILTKFKNATNVEFEDDQFYFSTAGGERYFRKYRNYRRTPGRIYVLTLVPSLEKREEMRRNRMKWKEEQAAAAAAKKVEAIEALKGVGI